MHIFAYSCCLLQNMLLCQGFFLQFREKAPGRNWEKMVDFTSKLGEINDIEHNEGTKIYSRNQVNLDCIMLSIPLKHKCLSITLIWVMVSHKYKWSLKRSIFFFFFLLLLIGKNRLGIGEKGGYFRLQWGRNSAPRERQKIPCMCCTLRLCMSN